MELQDQPLGDFLKDVAAKSPTPGGGAVAAVTAALAAALGQMVLRYSQGKKLLQDHAATHDEALARLERFGTRALELAADDAAAYGALNALWRLDPDDPVRREQWGAAVIGAIDPPREMVRECLNMLELIKSLLGKTNAMLDSDLAIAAVLAEAAARAGAWNVRINLPSMDDADEARAIEGDVNRLLSRCRRLCDEVERSYTGEQRQ